VLSSIIVSESLLRILFFVNKYRLRTLFLLNGDFRFSAPSSEKKYPGWKVVCLLGMKVKLNEHVLFFLR